MFGCLVLCEHVNCGVNCGVNFGLHCGVVFGFLVLNGIWWFEWWRCFFVFCFLNGIWWFEWYLVVLRLWEDHSRSSARETMSAMLATILAVMLATMFLLAKSKLIVSMTSNLAKRVLSSLLHCGVSCWNVG